MLNQLIKAIEDKNEVEAKRIIKQISPSELNQLSVYRDTALIAAAWKGLTNVCLALLPKMSDAAINQATDRGYTALSWAAYHGLTEVCLALLPKMSDAAINQATMYGGCTALTSAADKGHTKICVAIIKASPNSLHVTDKDGKTAYDIANSKGHKELAQILKQKQEEIEEQKRLSVEPKDQYSIVEDTNLKYSKDKLIKLLELQLKEGIYLTPPPVTNLENKKHLQDNLKTALNNLITNKSAVIPMHMQGEFSGIILKLKQDKSLQLIYINPNGKSLLKEANYKLIAETIDEYFKIVQTINPKILQQSNTDESGVYTVYNLLKLGNITTDFLQESELENLLKPTSDASNKIRAEHIILLKSHKIPVPVPDFLKPYIDQDTLESYIPQGAANSDQAALPSYNTTTLGDLSPAPYFEQSPAVDGA